jgi:hypothetical protein
MYEGLAHFLHFTHFSWLVSFSHKLKPLTSFVGTQLLWAFVSEAPGALSVSVLFYNGF